MKDLKLKLIITLLLISSLLFPASVFAKTGLILGVSSSAIEDQSMEESKAILLARLAKLGKSQFKDAHYVITDMATGNTLWQGAGKELFTKKRVEGLLEAVKQKSDTCSNLLAGWRGIANHIRQLKWAGIEQIHLVTFGSMLNTGDHGECKGTLHLPQLIPAQLRVERILEQPEIQSVHLMNVNSWQLPIWMETLEGTIEYFREKNKFITLNEKTGTQALLRRKAKTWLITN